MTFRRQVERTHVQATRETDTGSWDGPAFAAVRRHDISCRIFGARAEDSARSASDAHPTFVGRLQFPGFTGFVCLRARARDLARRLEGTLVVSSLRSDTLSEERRVDK